MQLGASEHAAQSERGDSTDTVTGSTGYRSTGSLPPASGVHRKPPTGVHRGIDLLHCPASLQCRIFLSMACMDGQASRQGARLPFNRSSPLLPCRDAGSHADRGTRGMRLPLDPLLPGTLPRRVFLVGVIFSSGGVFMEFVAVPYPALSHCSPLHDPMQSAGAQEASENQNRK